MADLAQTLLDLIKAHQSWAVAVLFLTAFGESFAFVGMFVPGTTILIASGALIKGGGLPYLPIMIGAILGAVIGDWVSYWLGRRFGGAIAQLWPFRRNPSLLAGGVRFFEQHGGKSVFIGRFFGPVRAIIPLAAGVMRMSHWRFSAANIGSALVWAPLLLLVGDVVAEAGERLFGRANAALLVLVVVVLFAVGAVVMAVLHWRRL